MFLGRLDAIFIGAESGMPMMHVNIAIAEQGVGLVGDRYATGVGTFAKPGVPDYELTLIEIEAIEAAAREYDCELAPLEMRRNLLTRDVPLNHLVGCEFAVGGVRLRGLRLCEPCSHLQKITGKKVVEAFTHRGGLRAQVLSGGELHIGDEIKRL